jgi:hypothetical protein
MSITKAEYDKLMEGRTRPLTDPHMSNAKASKWRAEEEASAIGDDDTVDRLVAVIEDRKRRNTKSNVVKINDPKRKGPKLVSLAVEVEQELDAAITRMDRYAYRKAQRATGTDPKDAA